MNTTLMDIACNNKHDDMLQKTLLEANSSYAEVYKSSEDIASFAVKLKASRNQSCCIIPFCHTVEAEAMGGHINLGDELAGSRAKDLVYKSINEILDKGFSYDLNLRLGKMLNACKLLKNQRETVAFTLSGPFSILSCLINTTTIFKSWRNDYITVVKLFKHFSKELLSLSEKICEAGADFISYADPIAIPKILGPKYITDMINDFTYDFLYDLSKVCEGRADILICPLTVSTLSGLKKIVINGNDTNSNIGRMIPQCINQKINLKSTIKLF